MSLEHAAGDRGPSRSSPFPSTWGPPPDTPAARAGWISANLSVDLIRAHRRGEVRALMPGVEVRQRTTPRDRSGVPLSIRLRQLQLMARGKFGP